MNRLWKHGIIVVALAAGIAGAGCTGGYTTVGASYSADYSYDTPSLAYVGPGIWVVEGYADPLFYSSGFYWRYGSGGWYRSRYYDRGFVYVRPYYVPRVVIGINRPHVYRNYYARPGTRVRVGPSGRVYVRDHRDYQRRRSVRGGRSYYDTRQRERRVNRDRSYYDRSRPTYRDRRSYYRDSRPAERRAYRQDVRQDRRELRRDQRAERRQARRDGKQKRRDDRRRARRGDRRD